MIIVHVRKFNEMLLTAEPLGGATLPGLGQAPPVRLIWVCTDHYTAVFLSKCLMNHNCETKHRYNK